MFVVLSSTTNYLPLRRREYDLKPAWNLILIVIMEIKMITLHYKFPYYKA